MADPERPSAPEDDGTGRAQFSVPPNPIVHGRFVSDRPRHSSLSPQALDLVQALREDPRALLGDKFVDELRESVKKNLTSGKSWWESSLLVALVPTLGGAIIATVWQAYSRGTDQILASEQRSYDRRVSLRAAFDGAVQRQVSALETICGRSTVGQFQQLKRKWILEPERNVFKRGLRVTPDDQQLLGLVAGIDDDIAQSSRVEQAERVILDKAYEISVSERRVDSYVGEMKAVFSTQETQQAADRFANAWGALEEEAHPRTVEACVEDLRDAAKVSLEEALFWANLGERSSLDSSELSGTQKLRKLACTVRADAVRSAYATLSSSAASELQAK